MSWREILLRLLSVFFLIAINAFFVITEFAVVSVRRSRINHLVLAGDLQAKTVQSLQRNLDRLLSTTQLGITLSSLALGWIGEGTMAVLIQNLITHLPFPPPLTEAVAHSLSIPVAFLSIVYLQIVLGELCPKSVALLYAEQIARFLAPASLVIGRVFNPFIWILNQSTRYLLKLIGIEYTGQGWYKQVTPEELQLIINTEKESSGLEAEERELLNNVFEFGDVEAKEVMTPHINIKALAQNATCQELLEAVAKTRYSRYPVRGKSLDDIQGMVDFKDLACSLAEGKITLNTPILKLIKPIRFFAESILLSELLVIMQRSCLKMVIIVDEYGGTSGLITRQDLINEIIGEEIENNSHNHSLIQKIDAHTFLVSAQINVEELNELLQLNLPLIDNYQTLGGFLLYQWQKIPHQGETLHFDDLKLTVTKAKGNRLHEIKISC
jgi:CBS domain containing-hemolysin-like protein